MAGQMENTNEQISPGIEPHESRGTGRIFAIAIGLLCIMVLAGVALMAYTAVKDAQNRQQHPVIGQP